MEFPLDYSALGFLSILVNWFCIIIYGGELEDFNHLGAASDSMAVR